MSELMMMSDQWLEFLNQSKAHQLAPFIVLFFVSCLSLVIFTDMSAEGILAACLNPLSFIVYYMVGVATFFTVPILVIFIALYLLMNCLVNLKTNSNSV